MKPLIVLVATFIIAAIALNMLHGNYSLALAGRIAISVMLVFTAIGHFAFAKGMAMMMPPFVPFKKALVYITGVIELIAAAGLLVNGYHRLAGCFLILFFIAILPANIYAAIHGVDHERASNDGNGIKYLRFRIPLQLLFIGWVYVAAILN